MNPGLTEMMATDRLMELRATAARRRSRNGPSVHAETAVRPAASWSGRRLQLANPQREIGWLLVSVGLRLAIPRTRSGSAR